MKRVMISVLSDYLQPNFLLIKEFDKLYDELVFISTEDMESEKKKKSFWLESALSIEKSIRKIIVSEDNAKLIKERLELENFSSEDKYIINLTGGTKVMSIVVYDFFKNLNSAFYYVPIGKNLIHELNSGEIKPLSYRINLKEYFTLYGLKYESYNKLNYSAIHTLKIFNKYKNERFNRNRMIEFVNAHAYNKSTDKTYYSGEWFEEYCYIRLKQENGLRDDQICKSAKIYRNKLEKNDNEIDVMFVKDNLLHIFECKMSISESKNIEDYLYKLAAITKDFGLKVNSYLLTLCNIKKRNKQFNNIKLQMLDKRRSILGIKYILDCNDFLLNKLSI